MESTDLLPLIPSILLTIVALYGAILSTMNFLNQRKRDKPQLKVVFWNDLDTEKGEVIDFHKYIVARNIGFKTVTLSHAYIIEILPLETVWLNWKTRGKKKIWPKQTDNYKIKNGNALPSGKCYEIEIFNDELDRVFGTFSNKKVIAVFVDQLGNQYKSKPIRDLVYFSD
jgi:hypothetical protein